MRRLLNQLWLVFVLPMTLVVVLFLAANTETGRELIVRGIEQASGGQVQLSGLGGLLPLAPRLARLELRDADGIWLEVADAALTVDGGALLHGTLSLDALSARTLVLRRLPQSQGAAAEPLQLPLQVRLHHLAIAALDLDGVLPGAPVLAVEGSGSLRTVKNGEASLLLRTPDPDGVYRLDIARTGGRYRLDLAVAEAPGGLLAMLAARAGVEVPAALGSWRVNATAEGPEDALSFSATVDAVPFHASASGFVDLDARSATELRLSADLPDLAAIGALAGVTMAGRARFDLSGTADDTLRLDATGELGLSEGPGPTPALLGPSTRLGLSVQREGDSWRVGSARIDGAGLKAEVRGRGAREALDLTWTLDLSDLGLLAPGWSGSARARGLLTGRPDAPELTADLGLKAALNGVGFAARTGPLSDQLSEQTSGRLSGQLVGRLSGRSTDWFATPVGTLDLTGDWAGRALAISVKAGRSVSGDLSLVLRDSRWASIAATGNLRLRYGAKLPQGDVRLRVEDLADLAPFLSLTAAAPAANELSGRLGARARLTEQGRALIEAEGDGLRLPGAVHIETLRMDTEVQPPLRAAATDATLRIDGLSVGATAGHLSMASLEARARLTGTPTTPNGTLQLQGRGLRLTEGVGRGIAPIQLNASATLDPSGTEIDATAETGAGSGSGSGSGSNLRLRGRISGPLFRPGRLALRAEGRVDIALLDPLLAGGGRQVSGQATLATAITGAFAAPRLDGTVRLTQAALHDRTLGLALTDIDGTLALTGDTLRVEQIGARAGAGNITVGGSVGLLVPGQAPGLPVDLRLVARNARPIQSDQIEIEGDADLRLLGSATERPTLSGKLLFSRVAIRLPERLPAGIVTLQVRERGQRRSGTPASTPPARAWRPELGLDLLVSAPRAVQVQGRGVEAELGGELRVRGTLADTTIDGGLDLVRGQYQLVGQTLRFTSGRLGFDGGAGLNPTLDLEARVSVAGSTAILSVLGTADAPRVALRGEPEMPQDEVLSRLLFGVAGGRLSPLQATRLGLAAASLAGIGEDGGLGVLERARAGLGLNRLSIGTDERGDAVLEGGRNLTERIYLGARQGTRSGEPQGVARIEVTPRVRLEADVGVTGGTRAGAAYEREY